MKDSILITGAEGFLGYHLIHFLSKKKINIFGTFYKKKNFLNKKNVKYLKCDIRKKKDIKEVLKISKPKYIFHLAAKSHPTFSFKKPVETLITNVIGTANLLDQIIKLKLNSKVVIACSSAQYGTRDQGFYPLKEKYGFSPDHIYGLSKNFQSNLADQYFKMFNLNVSNAIIFNTSGPGKKNDIFFDISNQYNLQKNKSKITIICGNINNKRDFLHYEDTVNALYFIAKRGKKGEMYNIATGKLIRIKELLIYLKQKIKKKIVLKQTNKKFRKFDEKLTSGCSKKLRELGWKPKKNYKDILNEMCRLI